MKIEFKEKLIYVTPDEGMFLFDRQRPGGLLTEIYMPKKFTEEQIKAKYSEISKSLFQGETTEPEQTTSKPQDIKTLRFSKLSVKAKLKELGLWETITKTLNEDEYEDLLIADDFAFDNELFVRVYESLKPQIPNIDEILRQCIKK